MDPFRLLLALGPIAVYLTFLGWMNLSRRPRVISGSRDTLALGLALLGCWVVGPMELFLPDAAATVFGTAVWGLMLVLYLMSLVLIVLYQRPRLTVYNVAADQLRPLLADLVGKLDPEARWAGDHIAMPNLGVQAQLDSRQLMRTVVIQGTGSVQNLPGWQKLHTGLTGELLDLPGQRDWRGLAFVVLGTSVFAGAYVHYLNHGKEVAQLLKEFLRL